MIIKDDGITFKALRRRRPLEKKERHEDKLRRCERQNRMVADIQKVLRSWWKGQTERPFIIVCEQGGGTKDSWYVIVNLTQLGLKTDEAERFKEGATMMIEGFQPIEESRNSVID